MIDDKKAFRKAYRDCLANCFATLTLGLASEGRTPGSLDRFRRCCELCREARKLVTERVTVTSDE